MWILKGKDNSHSYMPLRSKSYTIGKRSSAYLRLTQENTDDHHAKIIISQKTKTILKTLLDYENKTYLTCTIIDLDSSTGTFLMRNGDVNKLNPGESYQLTAGDRLQFGRDPNIYEVKFEKAVVFVPAKYDERKKVVADLQQLGIKVYDRLNSQCTHYVHPGKSITHKYAAALAGELWITGPDFWRDCVRAYVDGSVWPNVVDYQLKLKLSQPNSFIHELILVNYDINRSQLFKGMTFIFFNIFDIDDYGRVVKCAGGNVELYSKLLFEDKELDEQLLLVKSYTKDMTIENGSVIDIDNYKQIISMMDNKNRRMIRRSEITAAILKNSTKIYCNQLASLDQITGRKRPAETALVDENLKKKDLSNVIVIDDDSDDEVVPVSSKNTRFKKSRIDIEEFPVNVKPKVLDDTSKFTSKKPDIREKAKDQITWLSAKSEKKSNPVTKTKSDMEFLSPPASPANTISLQKLINLSQSIEDNNKAIQEIQTKLNFNPFKSIYDDIAGS